MANAKAGCVNIDVFQVFSFRSKSLHNIVMKVTYLQDRLKV